MTIDYGTQQVNSEPWFAWYPVKTTSGNIVWFKWVTRVVCRSDEPYLGLLPTVFYIE